VIQLLIFRVYQLNFQCGNGLFAVQVKINWAVLRRRW